MILFRYPTRRSQRRQAQWRWALWGLAIMFIPAVAFSAYQPAFLAAVNNLSDLANAGTARTNLGLGTAAVKAASGAGGTVASVTGSFTAGHMASIADTVGTVQDGGVAPAAPSTASLTGSSPFTLSSTNMVSSISNMATPAAATYNLPAPSANFRACVKDGTTNFATNNATVKSGSGNIDGTAGSTGIVMNQTHQELCFISDGTNYYVE